MKKHTLILGILMMLIIVYLIIIYNFHGNWNNTERFVFASVLVIGVLASLVKLWDDKKNPNDFYKNT